jgi:hypothetical protein
MDRLKLKLPNWTVLSMTIFTKGNSEDYLQHLITVLCLITQKGLDATCRCSAKELERASNVLEALVHNPIGPQGLNSKEDLAARTIEKKQTQEMLKSTKKEHESTMAQTYKFLFNLLACESQAQWDRICHKMHNCNVLAGLNREKHEGKCLHTWASFKDCLELHKLTNFSTDAAKRQKFYPARGAIATMGFHTSVRVLHQGTEWVLEAPPDAEEQPQGCFDHQER